MPRLRVHFLPSLIPAAELNGSTCVVIDVLRATTTMIAAFAAGARGVVPCLSIEDAQQAAAALPVGQAVLGGERRGLLIPGFALGNSPTEYTPDSVGGKAVVMTTTNGTKALLHCAAAERVLVAGFVNLSAVCQSLTGSPSVDILCAGAHGHVGRDDALVAGAIVTRLADQGDLQLDDSAALARDAWLHLSGDCPAAELSAKLTAALRASIAGQNLIDVGLGSDIPLVTAVDRWPLVAEFNAADGWVRASNDQ